jgi:hypothetical protein
MIKINKEMTRDNITPRVCPIRITEKKIKDETR